LVLSLSVVFAHHHYWAVNVPNDTLRNTAHKPSLYAAQPSTPHHHQTSVYLICQDDDLLDGPAHPDMRSRHFAAAGFDLL
jgi:hypothetical protein